MTPRASVRGSGPVGSTSMRVAILAAVLVVCSSGGVEAEQPLVQFCWALGSHDRTVYYAEAERDEDRSGNFSDLLWLSGLDVTGTQCFFERRDEHWRQRLLHEWREEELDVVDTTFLSDMDY